MFFKAQIHFSKYSFFLAYLYLIIGRLKYFELFCQMSLISAKMRPFFSPRSLARLNTLPLRWSYDRDTASLLTGGQWGSSSTSSWLAAFLSLVKPPRNSSPTQSMMILSGRKKRTGRCRQRPRTSSAPCSSKTQLIGNNIKFDEITVCSRNRLDRFFSIFFFIDWAPRGRSR